MNTQQKLQRVNALLDGELDLQAQLDMDEMVAQDVELQAERQGLSHLRDAIQRHADYHPASGALRAGLFRPGFRVGSIPVRGSAYGWRHWFAWRAFAVGLFVASVLTWAVGVAPWSRGNDDRLLREAVASHVRSTLAQRSVDVASADRHTVKPWLSARLDFSPTLPDELPAGVGFLGGRIDYLDDRAVAVLVYTKRQHVIDVYVWPTDDLDAPIKASTLRGFNAMRWARAGTRYWVVSDLNADELASVAAIVGSGR